MRFWFSRYAGSARFEFRSDCLCSIADDLRKQNKFGEERMVVDDEKVMSKCGERICRGFNKYAEIILHWHLAQSMQS